MHINYFCFFISKNNVRICGGSIIMWNPNTDTEEIQSNTTNKFATDGFVQYADWASDYGFTRFIYDRKWLIENNIYFPKLGMHEDIYLMSQIIFYASSIVHLPEVLYHYRKDNPEAMCAQDRRRRHMNSDINLLDLYENYRHSLKGSPIEKVAGGILMKAGWHSIIHGLGFFEKYPYLAGDIRKAAMSSRYRTPLLFQIFVKLYSLFK